MDFFLTLFFGAILTFVFVKYIKRPANLPPGPSRLPVLGSFPFLPADIRQGKSRMSSYLKEKYGSISSVFVGTRTMVFLTDYNLVKELYKMDQASFRPSVAPFHELRFGESDQQQRGLLQSSGNEWVEQRRFALRQLRDLGFGKSSMEDMINDEIDKLAGLLKKEAHEKDGKIGLNLRLNISIVNALWVLLVGEKLDLEDPHLSEIVSIIDSILRLNARINFVLNAITPELTKRFDPTYKRIEKAFEQIKALVKKYVDQHKETFLQEGGDESPRDFVDVYLNEIKKSSTVSSSFYGKRGEESLIAVLLDLFLAGTETTSTSLLWTFLYMLHYPDIQARVHAEIDKVVGRDRHVSLEDRANLPYTQAVLAESMRMASLVPAGLAHSVIEDIAFAGYTIPKGSFIFASVIDIHYDSSYWAEPEKFDPNRFYDPAKNVFIPNDRLIPFLIGKRFCLGQTLAEKEYFLFFAGLMQKFEFLPPTGSKADLPDISQTSGIQVGTIRCCPVYDLKLKNRD